MKKILSLLSFLILLSGCAESLALLGPASTTSLTGGNVIQSATTSALSYGVKKKTGKSPVEHVMAYAEKHNPEKKKSKCISFLEKTNSEICEAVKRNIIKTKKNIIKTKIVKSSKIEDLAKSSTMRNRR